MPVIETAENDIKERLSLGVVTWVAARAGCQLLDIKVDRDSIDVTLKPIRGEPVYIDAQLKSSSVLQRQNNHLLINLPIKNYNDLRAEVVGSARILIVLDLHASNGEWLSIDQETMVGKRLAYWHDLYGYPSTPNTTSKQVRIPLAQTFTPDNLRAMMQRRYDNILANVGGVS